MSEMGEQLALTQTPHYPNGPQEPLPPIDAEVVDGPPTREPIPVRYLGLAEPSKNETDPNVISIPDADVTEVTEALGTNSDSQPYVREPAQPNPQNGRRSTGSSPTYRAWGTAYGRDQGVAWGLLKATLRVGVPDSKQSRASREPEPTEAPKDTAETKGGAKIDTPEQLRSAYRERINAIVSSRVDLKGLGYDENTPLAQLHYLSILAANAMLERGFYIVPAAEQLRRAFKADKDHYASLSAASFETLAKAEVTQQEDDAARRELYAVASRYYDAKTLQRNRYQWATRAELQEIIEAARSSEVPPRLVDVHTKRWLGAKAASLGAVFSPSLNRTQAVV